MFNFYTNTVGTIPLIIVQCVIYEYKNGLI